MDVIGQQADFARKQGLFKAGSLGDVFLNLAFWKKSSNLRKVGSVDFLISHSWSCPSWMKILAICQYMNLDRAIALSNLACPLGALFLLLRAGSVSDVAMHFQGSILWAVMYFPLVIFLVVFLFGHLAAT